MSNSSPTSTTPADVHAIADVARETGLQKDTLRVWERRYGFPVPSRDAAGERRYGPDQLQRLHLIKRLLDAGCRPGGVVPLPLAALEERIQGLSGQPVPPRRTQRGAAVQAPAGTQSLVGNDLEPWLAWVRAGAVEPLYQALAQHALKHGLVHTVDQLLGPLGKAVGDAWWAGAITVYQEHLYSEAVQRFLQEAIRKADQPGNRAAPLVLLTTLPGEQHTLGLLMAECMLALEGCGRLSLGRDTPLPEVAKAVQQWQVDVVALSVSAHAPAADVWGGLKLLQSLLPAGVAIWVGGASAHLRRRGMPPGVRVVQSVGEIAHDVQSWRKQVAAV